MKRNIRKVLFSGFLAVLGVCVGILLNNDTYISSLLYYHDSSANTFVAKENNLAAVQIRVRTYGRTNRSHLIFRLREKGQTSWLVTNTYAVDRFADRLLYPFGFPPIVDSKGKTYEIDLSSPDATKDDHVDIVRGYQTFGSQYVFTRSELVKTPGLLVHTALEKSISLVTDPYSFGFVILWFIPLTAEYVHLPIVLSVLFIILFASIPVRMAGNTSIVAMVALGLVGYLQRMKAADYFKLAIGCIGIIPVAVYCRNEFLSIRLSLLVFILFVLGILFSSYERKT